MMDDLEAIEKKSKHIYSGVVHAGALEPMSNNESSFVGIYAANSPGMYPYCNM